MVLGTSKEEMSNDKFGTLCTESKFGFWGMTAVLILQVLMFGSAVAQWFTRKRVVSDHEKEGDRKTEFSL